MTNTDTDEAEHIRRLQAAFRFFRKIEDRQSDSEITGFLIRSETKRDEKD